MNPQALFPAPKSQNLLTNSSRPGYLFRTYLFLLAVLCCFVRVAGQRNTAATHVPYSTIGLPGVVHFTEKDFEAGVQNWMIAQDSLGILYFANTDGLLTYNGNDWHLYPLPNKTLVRSLVIGSDGKIYTGGQDEIGYYFPSSNGTLTYRSLKKYLPATERSFADVWNTGITGGRLYFRCTDRIMAIDTAVGNRRSVVYPAPSEWVYMACVR